MAANAKLPENRRRASASGAAPLVDAPGDPLPFDADSPAPSATTVRPPPPPSPRGARKKNVSPPAAPRPRSRLVATLQLTLGAMLVIAASVAVAWGARRYLLSTPRFAVRTVEVEGTRRLSAAEVAKLGNVAVGANVLALDLDAARAAIAADPWVESATVIRKLPATVRITVVEREARALVNIGGELYLATRDGDLFKKTAADDPYDLPVVSGILPDKVATDRAGAVLEVKRVLDVAEDLERAGVAKRWPIQELHLEKDGALVVTVGREAIALHLGHGPYRDKLDQLRSVLSELARRKANASVVFLDNDAHPERVVVRMR
jgi:cell division protein FtsQ